MEWIELDKLIKFQTKSKIKAGEGKSEGKYLMYTSSMIVDKYLDEFQYNEEALIMGTGGSASIHYSTGNFGTSTDCYVLYNKGKNIMLKYIYLYLLGNINILEEGFRGAGLKHTNQKYIKSIKIPVPSLKIQEKIVKVLDQAQALIDKRKEQIKALDQLIESIFHTMFGDPVRNEKGWEVKELEKVAPIKNHSIDEEIESVWLLNLDMIESNSGVLKEKIYVEIEDLPSSINCFSNKHILYSKLRPYLNKVFMPDDNGYCTSELVPLLPDCKVLNREYLLYLLRGRAALHYFNTHTSGARMPRVVMKDLKKMKISVPPLLLQNKFANKVETIEKQKEVLGESLELMEENYKSIMDKAFKGQLFN